MNEYDTNTAKVKKNIIYLLGQNTTCRIIFWAIPVSKLLKQHLNNDKTVKNEM